MMLEWTGERYLPYIDPSISGVEIHYEHLHRYAFASRFVKGKKVLDLACGEGYGTFILSKDAQYVVGIDIDPAAVSHAANTYKKENITFKEGSILNIPIKGKKIFDIIVCFEAIEHVKEHDILLSEIQRLLKEDGLLIISTPDKKYYSDKAGYQNPYHLNELYYTEFSELLQKYFSYVYLLGQQVFSGSSIFPLSPEKNRSSSEFVIEYGNRQFTFSEKKERDSRYYIAIASNIKLNPEQIQRSYLIDKSNAEIAFLMDKFNRSEESVHSLEMTISNKENQILQSQNTIQLLETTISTKENQILQSQNTIQLLETTISTKEYQILRFSNTIQSLESMIAEQDLKIQNSETRIRTFEEQVSIQNKELKAAKGQLDLSDQIIKTKESEIDLLNSSLNKFRVENDSLKSSISYRFLAKFQNRIIEPFFPPQTKRREIYDRGLRGGRILVNQGFRKLLSEYKQYRAFKKSKISALQIPSVDTIPDPKTEAIPDSPYHQTVIHLHDRNKEKSSEYVPLSRDAISLTKEDIKCIAFYLPQYHPIPENDRWWGKGFTEWTNVTKALPQFTGHYQPHLPDELGYYDLRLPEIQKRQIELARHYGIYGFCFYYYWFNGKRLLELPLDQFIADKELDFPFCICWANENWTRRWDGQDQEILISQIHSPENDIRFIHDVDPILRDPRYIRINGKPLILVYRALLLPEARQTTERWREYCRTEGIGEIYLVAALAFGFDNPEKYGFDAAVEFPPHTMNECNIISGKMKMLNPHFSGYIYDYEDFVKSKKYRKDYPYRCFRTVSPGWDNTARRRDNASVFHGANPTLYKEWLTDVAQLTKVTNLPGEQIVFINAWNEWAEGTHLEPDRKFGYGYLQATADAVKETRDIAESEKKKIIIVSHDAHLHGAQMLALHIAKVLKEQFHYEVYLLLKSGGILEEEIRKHAFVFNLDRDYPDSNAIDGLLKSLQQKGVSIAICNTVVTGDIVELLARRRIRTISLVHELPGIIRQMGMEENVKKIARFADKVIFPAEVVREKFSEIVAIDTSKCAIRPQGLFLKNKYKDDRNTARTQLREILSLPANSKIILNIGYADSRKGIDLFVDVACKVLKENPDIWFVWVGLRDESFMQSILKKIERSSFANRILFPGIRRDDIDIFYSGADIFLLTSREDPFPSVVLDAMNARLPVIGFDNAGGFKDIITETTGVLVPYLSVERMADAVSQILKDVDLQVSLGNNAADLIKRKFSFPDYIYELLGFLGHDYKKISVILPSYNYERYLPERLQSILSQTYPLYEIIAIDDNSKDRSAEILRQSAEHGPVPFKVMVNRENSGSVFRQWAKGIASASGDYIWIAEADDLSENRFLEEVMKGFCDETVVLSYSQSRQIDESGSIIAHNYYNYTNDVDQDRWKQDYLRSGQDEIRDSLAIKNTIPNVSAVVFKKVDISGIVEDLTRYKVAGDWYFYIWLLRTGSIFYHAESLNLHRRHKKSVTGSENAQQHFAEIVKVQNFVMSHFPVAPGTKEKVMSYRENIRTYLLN